MTHRRDHSYEPNYAVPPGETLLESLEALGMEQRELALRAGRSAKHINQIIQGKASITPETALQLERIIGVPARFWMSLEANYQSDLARIREDWRMERELERVKEFPYAEMVRRGWVTATRDARERAENLYRFFGVVSFDALESVCEGSWRIAQKQRPCHMALAAWVRKGELNAQDIETAAFDAKALKLKLPVFRELTRSPRDAFERNALQELCASCGVALVLVPHLKGTYAHGYTRWLAPDKALVQLSLRLKWDDVIWFSFFHELAHILLHGKRDVFVEHEDMEKTEKEREADQFAQNALLPPFKFETLKSTGDFSQASVLAFAAESGIAPSVVVGRLQHEGLIPWASPLSRLKTKLEGLGG